MSEESEKPTLTFCSAYKRDNIGCKKRLGCQLYSNFFILLKQRFFKGQDMQKVYDNNVHYENVKSEQVCKKFQEKQ